MAWHAHQTIKPLQRETLKLNPLDLWSQNSPGPHMTLSFDLLTHKVEHRMPLPHRTLVSIWIKSGSFVFRIASFATLLYVDVH